MSQLATDRGYRCSPTRESNVTYINPGACNRPTSIPDTEEDCDRFIPSENNPPQEQPQQNIPWYRRLFQNIVDKARNIWKTIRKYNPITHIFNAIERFRIAPHLRNARTRNGARTEEELAAYHRSLLYDPQNPDESRLFTEHSPQNPQTGTARPLIIINLGNNQTIGDDEEKAGLKRLFKMLKERHPEADIMMFRVGNASSELSYWACMTSDPSLHTNVVYEHTRNLINDRINCRGHFVNSDRVSIVISIGYSFGAGTQCNYLNDWQNIGGNTPVPLSVSIDAIELGTNGLGCPVIERPCTSQRHYNFYQPNSTLIRGTRFNGTRQRDICMCLQNDTHDYIDNNERLLRTITSIISRELQKPQ